MPSRLPSTLCAALLAAAMTLLAACGTAPPEHVRIGVVAPLSGPRSFIGTELVNGARLAVDRINERGGLLGEDVELIIVDDADLVDVPSSLADLAELQRVTAVIGPESAGVLLADRSPLSRRQVPVLLPTAFAGDLDDAATFVARTIPSARTQARVLGRWLKVARQGEGVAVLVADVVEGGLVEDDLRAGFADVGVDVVEMVSVDGEATNLEPAVRRLRDRAQAAGGADLVLLWGLPAATARGTLAARAIDWDVQLAVPSSSFVAEYRSLVGAASEGVVLPFPFRDEWFTSPVLTELLLRYYVAYGLGALPQLETLVLDVPVLAIAAADAVDMVAAAIEQEQSRDPAVISRVLPTITHDGVLRTYDLSTREAWSPDDVFVGRFHELATVFDVDDRMDPAAQQAFWESQVAADYIPQSVLDGPAGPLLERLLQRGRQVLPTYAAPSPPPGPVARPDDGAPDDAPTGEAGR